MLLFEIVSLVAIRVAHEVSHALARGSRHKIGLIHNVKERLEVVGPGALFARGKSLNHLVEDAEHLGGESVVRGAAGSIVRGAEHLGRSGTGRGAGRHGGSSSRGTGHRR